MNSSSSTKILLFVSLVFAGFFNAVAQNLNSDNQSPSNYAAISTGFPFLRITPDARSAAMAEAGVARSPDANALSINPSALVFLPQRAGFSISYNPWLESIAKDMSLSYFSAYLNNGHQAIGISLRYFSLGETTVRDEQALLLGLLHPVEYAVDFSYARKLGPEFSLAASMRYATSRLALNEPATAIQSSANALAVDISAYLLKPTRLFGYDADLSAGLNLSNIGPASFSNQNAGRSYLPANLRIGSAAALDIDDLSRLTIAADLNKLLVPLATSANLDSYPNFPSSMLRSFSDGTLAEELAEISMSVGLEYTFKQQFSLRAGYLYEHPEKGNRSHLSLGAGIQYQSMNLDLAYLPLNVEKSLMANTFKISLLFNFGHLAQNRFGLIRPN